MSMTHPRRLALVALAASSFAGLPLHAQASSPDAWEAMKKQMEEGCKSQASAFIRNPKVIVDPTGSPSYGLALVFGRSKQVEGRVTVLCAMNKATGAIEVGSEMSNDMVRVAGPKPKGEGGATDEE